MWASFERAHLVLLGAIFDALSAALRDFDPMATPPDFRLGDWALYAVGVYRHAGWQGLTADLASIEHTRSEAVIDGSPVARAVLNLIKTRVGQAGPWEGTPRALYEACRAYADEAGELAIFPKAPNTFTARLREARRSLSEHGIRVESGKSDNRRWVRIGRDGGGTTERPVTILEKVDRLGKARSASGNSSMRDGRDDTFGHSYGGALLQSKEAEGDTGAEDVPGHLGKTTVPIVPATRVHTTSGKIACQPAVRIKNRAGFWSLNDALDPYELHDIALYQKW